MRGMARSLGLLTLTAAFLVLAFGASSAQAAFGIEKWEALTCKANEDTPALGGTELVTFPFTPGPGECTKNTPEKWITQAGVHPPFGITDFILNSEGGFPEGFVKDIVVDTPEGLDVNPEAYPKCPLAQAEAAITTCPLTDLVGINYLTVAVAPGSPPVLARSAAPVYNVEPFEGHPSMVAFPDSTGKAVFIVGSLSPVDQHVIFTISNVHEFEPPTHPAIVRSRLVFFGVNNPPFNSGNGTYLTLPTQCEKPGVATLTVDSHEGAAAQEPFTTPYTGTGCNVVPFKVNLGASSSGSTDSPEPATVDVQMPDQLKAGEPIANSHLLTAKVTLPEGAGINPSLANGLTPCTNAQFKKGTDSPAECPASSRIGSVEVESRAIDQKLGGDVYVAQPLNQVATSGEQFRIFIHAFNTRYGINVRLIGHLFPNLNTGQLTAVVPENPQAPFNSFKVHLNGGARGALTSPDICGPHTVAAKFVPWARPGEEVPSGTSPQFTLSTLPGGGPCPKTLAERPFSPTYSAGPQKSKAGAFSPFEFHLARPDGAQEIRQINVNLPPGMVAKLKGTEYCPQAKINAATASSGVAEQASPSCPANSQVGTFSTNVGSGPAPFHTTGKAYLAGPYKGAPISMVFVTPAVAGPYDLGTVVVRVAINVDPEKAEIHAVSDPIPFIFGGVKLDIRSIDVSVNRSKFTLNPTTCRSAFPVASSIFGGGANPANPASWFESKQSTSFRATECGKLKFKPKFFARILGGKGQTQRADNPKFRAILEGRNGDANVRRTSFILPRATILDQAHIKTICTRVQLAANECPKNSIYGHAKAKSPLLDKPLKGPVYLTSSSHELPDLLVNLRGQVPIRLRGVISSAHGRLKTVFNETPDVAVSKFELTMKGGNKGLLVNSRDLCSRPTNGFLNIRAQNSRQVKRNNLRLNIPACQGGKKH